MTLSSSSVTGGVLVGLDAKNPQNAVAAAGEKPFKRVEEEAEKPNGMDHAGGHFFGVGKRDPFGHQLADEHRGQGDQEDHRDEAHGVGRRRQPSDRYKLLAKRFRQGGLAKGSYENADEGNADLHGR